MSQNPRESDHSPDCKKWFLAFSYVKSMLQKAQATCPCCIVKRSKDPLVKTQKGVEKSP